MVKRIKNFNNLTDKEIIEKISSDSYDGGNILLSPNASLETKTKYQIGKAILAYQLENKLELFEVVNRLKNISEMELYDICRGKVDNFSLPKLVGYLEKLAPDYEVEIAKGSQT